MFLNHPLLLLLDANFRPFHSSPRPPSPPTPAFPTRRAKDPLALPPNKPDSQSPLSSTASRPRTKAETRSRRTRRTALPSVRTVARWLRTSRLPLREVGSLRSKKRRALRCRRRRHRRRKWMRSRRGQRRCVESVTSRCVPFSPSSLFLLEGTDLLVSSSPSPTRSLLSLPPLFPFPLPSPPSSRKGLSCPARSCATTPPSPPRPPLPPSSTFLLLSRQRPSLPLTSPSPS